jgi:hypothetical protein
MRSTIRSINSKQRLIHRDRVLRLKKNVMLRLIGRFSMRIHGIYRPGKQIGKMWKARWLWQC